LVTEALVERVEQTVVSVATVEAVEAELQQETLVEMVYLARAVFTAVLLLFNLNLD
jgi:hypothetical protein